MSHREDLKLVHDLASLARQDVMTLVSSDPALLLAYNENTILATDAIKDLILPFPHRRLMVRQLLTRLHAIAVAVENCGVDLEIVDRVDGTYLALTAHRWKNFIEHRRARPGFTFAFEPLIRLTRTIAERRKATRAGAIWDEIRDWCDGLLEDSPSN